MEHVRPIELIQFAAGELAEPRRAEIAEHLDQCPECRANLENQNTLWNMLGEWSPDMPSRDLLTGVDRALESTKMSRTLPLRLWRLTRLAAAIVIGVGAGYFASSARLIGPLAEPETAAAIEDDAVEALGLNLMSQTPAELYAGLLDLEQDSDAWEGES